jgi:hypothetical protein
MVETQEHQHGRHGNRDSFIVDALNRLHEFLARYPGWILAALFGLYLLGAIYRCRQTKFWFDEYLTLDVAQSEDLGAMMRAVREGGDLVPPAFHLFTRAAVFMFGSGRVGLRATAIVGFAVMLFSVYWFVRRRCGPVAGMIAFMIPALTEAAYFSTDARPYGLVLAFLGLAAVAWQIAIERETKRFVPLAAFGLAASLAVACHYLVLFAIAAFGVAELYRTYRTRRFDWGMWMAMAMTLLPILIASAFRPHDLSSQNMAGQQTAHVRDIPDFYKFFFQPFVVTASAVAVLICGGLRWLGLAESRDSTTSLIPFTKTEMVMALGLFLSPLPTVAGLMPLHSYYNLRYDVSAVIGFCIIFVTLVVVIARRSRALMAMVFVVMAICFVTVETEAPRLKGKATGAENRPVPASLRGDLLIYLNDPFLFMEFRHTWKKEDASRLRYVTDRKSALRYVGHSFIDSILETRSKWKAMPVVSLEAFERDRRPFLLYYSVSPRGWLFARLQQDGAMMQAIQAEGENMLFLVDRFNADRSNADRSIIDQANR